MDKLVVGIADMKIGRAKNTIVTYALGSCIGICLYDPVLKLGAMIHIMLPNNLEKVVNNKTLYKYADTGIPTTIKKMEAFGASRQRMYAKIAGGAKMFNIPGNDTIGSIGDRNIVSVKQILQRERIRLVKEDVGLSHARTLTFDISTGDATITSYGKPTLVM